MEPTWIDGVIGLVVGLVTAVTKKQWRKIEKLEDEMKDVLKDNATQHSDINQLKEMQNTNLRLLEKHIEKVDDRHDQMMGQMSEIKVSIARIATGEPYEGPDRRRGNGG